MRLGIPAAYDRMGTYYMNGTGVKADATRAYAFWQKAAEMGNPQAMTFLGDKLRAGKDGAIPGYWANIPVAIKMLECALGQGHGQAAFNLYYMYEFPRDANGHESGARTRETKDRALKVLHAGVALGCRECADALAIEFGDPFDLAEMLPPHIDKARGERYGLLGDELGFNPSNRFPNLDMVLPLPPADLPAWNGDRNTLLAAAMGVSLPLTPPQASAASQSTGRSFLDAAYALRETAITTRETRAPMGGYWRPTAPDQSDRSRAQLESVAPGLYQQGEMFDRFRIPSGEGLGPLTGVVWEYSLTVRHNHGAIEPQVPDGLARKVAHTNAPMIGVTAPICPTTGIWQPWVPDDHPMHTIVNQYWRQVWLLEGQPFPQPQRDWMLALPEHEVTWYLLDTSRANIS
ncbi:MAG: DUF6396 domain-containing protein [Telluria sp.]|nr:DUF6396 domain-containing protein [Telluria sp.]